MIWGLVAAFVGGGIVGAIVGAVIVGVACISAKADLLDENCRLRSVTEGQ